MINKNKILFIDGPPRSGKSALCQTVVALKNMEHVDLCYDFEYIFAGLVKKKIDLTFAKEFINSHFSRYTFDKILGRNINLRKDDFSGIYNFYNPKLYLDRLKQSEFKRYHYAKSTKQNKNDYVLKELNSSLKYFPFQSHYLLENFSILKKLNLNFKLIRLSRHPIDIIYSQIKRGRGKIIGNKKYQYYRNATYNLKKKSIFIPWFVDIAERKYINFAETERIVYTTIQNLEKLEKIKTDKRVIIIDFDKLCTNPNNEFKKICRFLSVKSQKNLSGYLVRSNLPRKIDYHERKKKYKFILKNIKSLKLKKKLNDKIYKFEINQNLK